MELKAINPSYKTRFYFFSINTKEIVFESDDLEECSKFKAEHRGAVEMGDRQVGARYRKPLRPKR